MDELEAIFDKLRKCMAGRVSESVLIEVDVAEIRTQQLLLRERAKYVEDLVVQCTDAGEIVEYFGERGVLSEPTKKWQN